MYSMGLTAEVHWLHCDTRSLWQFYGDGDAGEREDDIFLCELNFQKKNERSQKLKKITIEFLFLEASFILKFQYGVVWPKLVFCGP